MKLYGIIPSNGYSVKGNKIDVNFSSSKNECPPADLPKGRGGITRQRTTDPPTNGPRCGSESSARPLGPGRCCGSAKRNYRARSVLRVLSYPQPPKAAVIRTVIERVWYGIGRLPLANFLPMASSLRWIARSRPKYDRMPFDQRSVSSGLLQNRKIVSGCQFQKMLPCEAVSFFSFMPFSSRAKIALKPSSRK